MQGTSSLNTDVRTAAFMFKDSKTFTDYLESIDFSDAATTKKG